MYIEKAADVSLLFNGFRQGINTPRINVLNICPIFTKSIEKETYSQIANHIEMKKNS
jgi:hypothetical protein